MTLAQIGADSVWAGSVGASGSTEMISGPIEDPIIWWKHSHPKELVAWSRGPGETSRLTEAFAIIPSDGCFWHTPANQ